MGDPIAAPAGLGKPIAFFAVLLALAIPIWLLSPFLGVITSMHVPVTDLMLGFAPCAAGCILIFHAEGAKGLADLFRRGRDGLRPSSCCRRP